MFCRNCGKELKDTARFCTNCGSPQENPETPPTPVPTPVPTPAPTPPVINPLMLKVKTPYYWISKICLVLVIFCFLFTFVSGMNVEKFFKDTSYSGFKLFQLAFNEYANGENNQEAIVILCPLFGIMCSALFALISNEIQRFFEFTGVLSTIGMILVLNNSLSQVYDDLFSDIEILYNLVKYEVGFGLYLIIVLFVLAFIFATADKHVVKAQKQLQKQQTQNA